MSPKMRVVRKVLVNKRTGERTACYIACRDDREPGRPRPLNARGTVSSDHHSNASSSSATTVEESFECPPATCESRAVVVMLAKKVEDNAGHQWCIGFGRKSATELTELHKTLRGETIRGETIQGRHVRQKGARKRSKQSKYY